MAPLIYSLIRSTRPVNVLEVGAGYTTLFALQALADNAADADAEHQMLLRAAADRTGRAGEKLRRELPFLTPQHHEDLYTPMMVTIDAVRTSGIPAAHVGRAAESLGLDKFLTFLRRDFRGCSAQIDPFYLPFDFAFFDCGGHDIFRPFMQEYWPLVKVAGGLIVVHSTLTNAEGLEFIERLKSPEGRRRLGEFELLSLMEPHKTKQSSFTMLRRIGRGRLPGAPEVGGDGFE
jgi:hypothetical protein